MFILDFCVSNYALLVMLTGMFIMTLFDVYFDRSMIIKLRTVLCLIFALVVFDEIEGYTGSLADFTYWRISLSVICYSLRPVIIMMLAFIVRPKISKVIIIPAVVNFLVISTAFFSDVAFSFEYETNHFVRGALGYTTYIITVLYIMLLYYITIRTITSKFSEEGVVLLFIALTATLSALISFFGHSEVVNLTYSSNVLLYYMYLYAQYTKRDPLTSVYNRQAFQSDLKKHPKAITGIISADMNGLKSMNDENGHQAGDKALIEITRCFCQASTSKERVYRIGGDEFAVICRFRKPEEMQKLVEDIRSLVERSGYSCAFGLSYGKSIDDMMYEADKLMYKDKLRIKEEQELVSVKNDSNTNS